MKNITYSKKPHHFLRPNDDQLQQLRAKRASSQQQATLASARAICNASSQRSYAGQELRPYDGRPGSLDHLDLPSRIGDALHYRSRASVITVHTAIMPA